MAIPLSKFAPYDLQWFHVMCHILPRSIRAYDLKHTRFVQYKAYLITRVSEPRTLSVIKKVRITMGEKIKSFETTGQERIATYMPNSVSLICACTMKDYDSLLENISVTIKIMHTREERTSSHLHDVWLQTTRS